MFSIGFRPDVDSADRTGGSGSVGEIRLDDFRERFIAPLIVWSEAEYVWHWEIALGRLDDGMDSAFLTEAYPVDEAAYLRLWPCWVDGDSVVFTERMLLREDFSDSIDLDRVWLEIPGLSDYFGGDEISRWRVQRSSLFEVISVLGD